MSNLLPRSRIVNDLLSRSNEVNPSGLSKRIPLSWIIQRHDKISQENARKSLFMALVRLDTLKEFLSA